jgi:hypothetical protein
MLEGHEVAFVEKRGWKGKVNGELRDLVARDFDVMVTSDGNLIHQQSLNGRDISFVVMPSDNLTVLRTNALAVRTTLDDLAELPYRALIVIGRRTLRRLDGTQGEAEEIGSVRPFRRR